VSLIRRVGGRRSADDDVAEARRKREALRDTNWDGDAAPKPIVKFNVEYADYVGDEDDGCYYQAGQGPGGNWYVTVVVDCGTGSFCMDLVTDEGPYPSEEQAKMAGRDAACDWCHDNDVDTEVEG
jgi:hypothetical protein